jgi:hypothetical protein
MSQLQLCLLGRVNGPSVIPVAEIEKIKTYREAVIACWLHRRVRGMTNATLCQITGMRPSHLSDYLSPSEVDKRGNERRDMPAKYIPAFELVAGNTFVSQWLATQSHLTILESIVLFCEAA